MTTIPTHSKAECAIMEPQDTDDWDLDTAWAQQEMCEQQMLDDDPGYSDFLVAVALNQLNSRTI